MRVLVTGGAGFIGSHLAQGLVDTGHEVVVLDNLSNGERRFVPDAAVFVEGDVRSERDVDRGTTALPTGPVEAICHLAGQASTFRSFENPSWDMEVNGVGTTRILESARRHSVRTLLFASSMTAYGHPQSLPVSEDMVCQPISFYGITKWAAEQAVLLAAKQHAGLRASAFRMFNVYGERQSLTNPYQGVIAIFVGNVLRGEPIRIFGDGEQSRDFVYIGDVVEAWLRALEKPPEKPLALNLGTGTRVSINRLWRAVVAACGENPESWPVRYEEGRPGDQHHMQASIEAAHAELGWAPATSLEDGLSRTVAWAREESGAFAHGNAES